MPGFHDDKYTPESALATLRVRPAARDIDEWMKAVPPAGKIEGAIYYSRDHHLKEAIPLLPAYLRDAPWFLARAACVTLGELGGLEALPDLLDLVRPAAGDERGLFSTEHVYYDETPQEGAIEGLGRLGLTAEGRTGLPLLSHPDEAIRRAAAAVVPELLALLAADSGSKPPIGDYWILYALAFIGTPEAAPGARLRLDDADRHVREAASHLLERLARQA